MNASISSRCYIFRTERLLAFLRLNIILCDSISFEPLSLRELSTLMNAIFKHVIKLSLKMCLKQGLNGTRTSTSTTTTILFLFLFCFYFIFLAKEFRRRNEGVHWHESFPLHYIRNLKYIPVTLTYRLFSYTLTDRPTKIDKPRYENRTRENPWTMQNEGIP